MTRKNTERGENVVNALDTFEDVTVGKRGRPSKYVMLAAAEVNAYVLVIEAQLPCVRAWSRKAGVVVTVKALRTEPGTYAVFRAFATGKDAPVPVLLSDAR